MNNSPKKFQIQKRYPLNYTNLPLYNIIHFITVFLILISLFSLSLLFYFIDCKSYFLEFIVVSLVYSSLFFWIQFSFKYPSTKKLSRFDIIRRLIQFDKLYRPIPAKKKGS